MTLPALLSIVLVVSLTAYAVFAGTDFGAGVLDLGAEAGSGRAAAGNDREAIAASIGPLWEANHVWLIFSITILFSAFPRAFSALGTGLLAPFTVALLAIVVRSVALGLRGSPGTGARSLRLLSRAFGVASAVAPFAFGIVAGGLAKAAFARPAVGSAAPSIPWTSPFALVVGALAVALCAALASGFVTLRLARAGEHDAADRFRRRGIVSAGCLLVLMLTALLTAALTAPALWHRLVGTGLPFVVAGLAAVIVSLLALERRRYLLARGAGAASAAALLWGWFAAQSPRLVGPHLTLHTAATTHAALVAVALSAGLVLVLVLPAMFLLFTIFDRPVLEASE